MALGQIDIAAIVFNPKSRDDIPQILCGLQYLYLDPDVRQHVFPLLEEVSPERAEGKGKVSPDTGRPGITQWRILVLGVGDWQAHVQFELQTLKDNLRLFTTELLDRINQEVVRAGRQALKQSPEDGLNARADAFVCRPRSNTPPILACSTRPSARR